MRASVTLDAGTNVCVSLVDIICQEFRQQLAESGASPVSNTSSSSPSVFRQSLGR